MSKFAVGEICEVSAITGQWFECEIIENRGYPIKPTDDYTILIPNRPSDEPDKSWGIAEKFLRKKRPPEQLDNQVADQEFIDDLKGILPITWDEKV